MTVLPALQNELLLAARRMSAEAASTQRKGRAWRLRRSSVVIALAGLVLVGGAVAAAATILWPSGAPAPPIRTDINRQITPQSERLSDLRVPEGAGGAVWGLSFFRDRNGLVCVQVGRVFGERLAYLGDDGALHDLNPGSQSFGCGGLAGAPLADDRAQGEALMAENGQPCDDAPIPCPDEPARLRSIRYGVLGPDATTASYAPPGGTSRELKLSAEGAFLIIQPGRGPVGGFLRVIYADGSVRTGNVDLGARDGFIPAPPPEHNP
jgi:hypothetical protein